MQHYKIRRIYLKFTLHYIAYTRVSNISGKSYQYRLTHAKITARQCTTFIRDTSYSYLPWLTLKSAVNGVDVVVGNLRVLKLNQRLRVFQQQFEEIPPRGATQRGLVIVVDILLLLLSQTREAFAAEEEDGDVRQRFAGSNELCVLQQLTELALQPASIVSQSAAESGSTESTRKNPPSSPEPKNLLFNKLLLLHLFSLVCRTTWVSRYQKGKPVRIVMRK